MIGLLICRVVALFVCFGWCISLSCLRLCSSVVSGVVLCGYVSGLMLTLVIVVAVLFVLHCSLIQHLICDCCIC